MASWFSSALSQFLTWLLTLLIPFAVSGLLGGCVKTAAGDTYEQKSAAASQNSATMIELMDKLGIEGDAMVNLGPAYFGLFEGLLVDSGIRAQVHAKVSPQQAKLLTDALQLVADGKSVDEAAEIVLAENKVATSQKVDE